MIWLHKQPGLLPGGASRGVGLGCSTSSQLLFTHVRLLALLLFPANI